MKSSLLILLILSTNLAYAQTIPSVQIGTQVWMSRNLDVSTFRNGSQIPQAKSNDEWQAAGRNKQPAWCYYETNPANGPKYGKLYNGFAVGDLRGICPTGWHVPTDAEWTTITNFLGGTFEIAQSSSEQEDIQQLANNYYNASTKLKQFSATMRDDYGIDVSKPDLSQPGGGNAYQAWVNMETNLRMVAQELEQRRSSGTRTCPNCASWNSEYRSKVPCHVCKDTRSIKVEVEPADNSIVGFVGFPGGLRFFDGSFSLINKNGFWWSSTGFDSNDAWCRYFAQSNGLVGRGNYNRDSGLSVRCIKN